MKYFLKKKIYLIYLLVILILAIQSVYLTQLLYKTWIDNSFSRLYLPPYQPINYFIQYSFFHFWSHFLAALIFSLAILLLAKYFNKKSGEKYFWPEEIYFIVIAILIVGYPGWLVYFLLILLTPLLFAISHLLLARKPERLSYYHLWLPLAILAIIISRWLATFSWWSKLII